MLADLFEYYFRMAKSRVRREFIFLSILLMQLLLISCADKPEKKFRIGFSQCASDVWRQNMQKEMERELSFHPEIDFIFKQANLSSEKQIGQIQELIDEKVDLIIACPAQAKPITP